MFGLKRGAPMGAILGLLLAGGCSGDGGGVTDPLPQTPTLQISTSPTSLSIQAGNTGQFTVNATRGGGFSGAVSLTVEGLPSGVTVNAPVLAAGSTSAVVTLTAAAGATAGSSTLTVRGQGTGVNATASVALTVTAAPPAASSYTVALAPASLSIQQGASGTSTLTLSRTNFTGAVALAVTGAPAGVTVSVSPASVTGNEAVLTIQAADNATVGNASLTVTATATGLANRTATLPLAITQRPLPPPGSGNVTYSFCAGSDVPIWFAFQDGNGPWTRVQGTGNSFSFQVNSDRGAVAQVTRSSEGTVETQIQYLTRAEMIGIAGELCPVVGSLKTVQGTITGLGPLDFVFVSLGSATTLVQGAMGGSFTLENVPPGAQDLVAARLDLTFRPSQLLLRRDLNPANNSTLPALNFATEGFAPVQANFSLTGVAAGEQSAGLVSLVTKNGTAAPFMNLQATGSYSGFPSSRLVDGDFHFLSGFASTTDGGSQRIVSKIFRQVANQTLALGPALTVPTLTTVSGGANARIRVQFPIQSAYNRWWIANFAQENRDVEVSVAASQGWLGAASEVSLTLPDLSGLSGWNSAWGLQGGQLTNWGASAVGWSGGTGVFQPNFSEGTTIQSAGRAGTFTP